MRIGSLFSGAGGLDLAALDLFPGSTMAWHAEIDPAASRVLAHHWPDVPNLGSVTEIDWHAAEPVDVLCGGFPCQDVSAAGLRTGLSDGTRSGLWSHMAEAIDALRPRWVLIENVRGLLSAPAIRGVESDETDLGHGGGGPVLRALGAVLGDLADRGFDAEWTCFRASDVGACHRRERVFILAWPADAASSGLAGLDDGAGSTSACGGGERIAGRSTRGDAGPVALLPTPRASDGSGGPNPLSRHERMDDVETRVIRMGGEWGEYAAAICRHEDMLGRLAPAPIEQSRHGNPRLSPAFAEWMMMWPVGWTTDPAIGLSRNEQLRIIGNGVVPRQATAAFRHLLDLAAVPA